MRWRWDWSSLVTPFRLISSRAALRRKLRGHSVICASDPENRAPWKSSSTENRRQKLASSFVASLRDYNSVLTLWRGGVVVRASDLQPADRRFESRPLRFTYNPGQVVHTHVPLFTKQYRYRRKLGAKQTLHAAHCTYPVSVDLQLRLRTTETKIIAARLWLGKDFSFSLWHWRFEVGVQNGVQLVKILIYQTLKIFLETSEGPAVKCVIS